MPDWRGAARRVVGSRADVAFDRAAATEKRVRERWAKLPGSLRDKLREWVRLRLGNFSHIADSARLILHGGILALSLYIFGYLGLAWLDMSGSFYRPEMSNGYLFRFVAWLLGPHQIPFWLGFSDTIELASHLIIEPLRVCLIASTVAYCLEQVQPREPTTAAAPASDPGTS